MFNVHLVILRAVYHTQRVRGTIIVNSFFLKKDEDHTEESATADIPHRHRSVKERKFIARGAPPFVLCVVC